MDNVKLLDRLDTKFTFRIEQLPGILEHMTKHYYLLDVNGLRVHQYHSLYYDTNDFQLYTRHQNGKLNRYKIRYRRYADSGLCFFEIKFKNNKGRTIKDRIRRSEVEFCIQEKPEKLLRLVTPYAPDMFTPKIWVDYQRMTFVNKHTQERLTIDRNLTYRFSDTEVSFPKLVIAELKQEKGDSLSPFKRLMLKERIKEGSISKYCFGIATLYPHVKKNLFKPNIIALKKIVA